VKLLLDQNLSSKLLTQLSDLVSGSVHVRFIGMAEADDTSIWNHAKAEGFTIASKDGDFHQLSLLYGAPPKVIWLRVGNAPTEEIADLMRARQEAIDAFIAGDGALLVLDR
jgi:predicted nuclease of predicted toxin-antitoxin system